LLGIFEAGAAFLPLDPAHPLERLAFQVRDSGAVAVLADGSPEAGALLQALPEGVKMLPLVSEEVAGEDAVLPRRPHSRDLAYLIYTSGTTGVPKAVAVEHASLLHTLDAAVRSFEFAPGERMPSIASFSFDIFLFE